MAQVGLASWSSQNGFSLRAVCPFLEGFRRVSFERDREASKLGSFHVVEELRKFPLDSGAAASIHKQNEQMEKALRGG